MKIVILTGAGISKESGISTFRDSSDGLWNKFRIEAVASPNGWKEDPDQVIDFYSQRKIDNDKAEPNKAHKYIAELEKEHNVVIITQNVDDLHERAGSTNIIHVHGSLTEVRSTVDPSLIYTLDEIGCDTYIKYGSRCEKNSRLRPNIVWFGENPLRIEESYNHAQTSDIFITIGTSFNVNTAFNILSLVGKDTKKILIDPGEFDSNILKEFDVFIKDSATEGVLKLKKYL